LRAAALVIGSPDPLFVSHAAQLGAPQCSSDLPASRVRRRRWSDELWRLYYGRISSGRRLHWAHSQRREAL
jgi:hypothetical protein